MTEKPFPSSPTKYAPRWADYDEWRNLNLNMSPDEVVSVLGEPYMALEGYIQDSKLIEIILFKLKPKYTDVGNGPFREVKPQKQIDKTIVWGEYYDLICTFENKKLIKWYTINMKHEIKDSIQDNSSRNKD